LAQQDHQNSIIDFMQNVNMTEQEMENIWVEQYQVFVEAFLAKIHHNYDLRPKTNHDQTKSQKVIKKVQKEPKEVVKPMNEPKNKELLVPGPTSFNITTELNKVHILIPLNELIKIPSFCWMRGGVN
jgi:hypothetical protein